MFLPCRARSCVNIKFSLVVERGLCGRHMVERKVKVNDSGKQRSLNLSGILICLSAAWL